MPMHHKGSLKEARALDCYIKLSRAADSAMAKVCRRLADVQLTGTQFGTLEALYHLGPLSTGQIAAKLLKPAAISRWFWIISKSEDLLCAREAPKIGAQSKFI